MNRDKKCKVTIYDEERVKIQFNNFNPFKNRDSWVMPTKIKNIEYPYMTKKQYIKQLKQARKKCANLKLNPNKCVFLTLTTQELFEWADIKVKFDSFIRCAKRTFGKLYYIRVFESSKNETHLHIHLIIMFESEKPKDFNEQWVINHWKYGIIDFQRVVEPYGILDYITNYKTNNISNQNSYYTKFPQFVKILTRSLDFPQAHSITIDTTIKGAYELLEHYNNKNKNKNGNDLFCYNDGHYYIDYETGEYNYCLDNQYYHNTYHEE